MRILITGVAGFAARHFLEYLDKKEPGSEVWGIYHENLPDWDIKKLAGLKITLFKADLSDKNKITEIISNSSPDFILHLAGRSSVADSWKHPVESIIDNTNFFLNIAEAVRNSALTCRILSVGSTEEYGTTNLGKPLTETDCPEPASPYGVARVLQQKMVAIYANSYKVDIVHTRSFNHIGPYQKPAYVISSFAKQVAQQALAGRDPIELKTGDINVVRDFTDVRDVVIAYYGLLYKGKTGETYNVCSGRGYLLKDIIDILAEKIGVTIQHSIDEHNFRPAENKIILGSYEKISAQTGWKPMIGIAQSLDDILSYWKSI